MSEDCNTATIATETIRTRLNANGHSQVEIVCASNLGDATPVSITI
jgi:hypothetical protein